MVREPEGNLQQPAKPVLPTKYWFPLLVALIVTGAILAVSEFSSRSFNRTRNDLGQSMGLQSKLLELQKNLAQAEAGQRGFLLTHKPEYRSPYDQAVTALPSIATQARDLAAEDKPGRDMLAALTELIALKMATMRSSLERADTGDFEGALALLDSTDSRALDARTTAAFESMAQRNTAALADRAARWEDSLDASRSGILAVVGLNAALIALLALVLIRDTRRARENAQIQASFAERMKREVDERTAQLSALSEFLQVQSESEKAKLAGELHDELSRFLTPAQMDVNWLAGKCDDDGEVTRRLTRLTELLDSGIDVKRRIIENLRPSLLDHLGLVPAVRWHVEEACKAANLRCNLDVQGNVERLSPDVEIALYRVVQESMANIVRHARAGRVDILLERMTDGIGVTVRDDGVGMADVKVAARDSYGIEGMRQRLRAVGGRMDIDSRPGSGTAVRAFVPQRLSEALDATLTRQNE
ncbi:hypothetical protein DSM104443_00235 [Usitatibacter rugosus]|uniref:Histidine kinase domain-containing protein n=1 Tax=Usitatibacter rugosus TaxID=2732067 RepID=A0A6M4GQZ3_9PROT|nr:CHASE3 domain-containing protein [Usitatibacter rugosus]QJR09198.1 hypothetical protein DSM104443_00235 [Usitatibacter rugosus]